MVFLCEIGIGIAGYVKHGQLESILEKGFNSTMTNYEHNEEAWKLVQTELECCGTKGPRDWEQVFHNATLPIACCHELPVDQANCDLSHSYKEGCMPKLLHFFESKSMILAGVCVGVALIQVNTKFFYFFLICILNCCLFLYSLSVSATLAACTARSGATTKRSKRGDHGKHCLSLYM